MYLFFLLTWASKPPDVHALVVPVSCRINWAAAAALLLLPPRQLRLLLLPTCSGTGTRSTYLNRTSASAGNLKPTLCEILLLAVVCIAGRLIRQRQPGLPTRLLRYTVKAPSSMTLP
jgi:hypothetical protein